MVGGQ
jgi:hypothetical protein